jgi:hypothetical protein
LRDGRTGRERERGGKDGTTGKHHLGSLLAKFSNRSAPASRASGCRARRGFPGFFGPDPFS